MDAEKTIARRIYEYNFPNDPAWEDTHSEIRKRFTVLVEDVIMPTLKSAGWLDPNAQAKAKCDFCQGRRSFPSGTGTPRENQPCPICRGKGEVGLIFNGRPLLNKETAQAALEGWHVRNRGMRLVP